MKEFFAHITLRRWIIWMLNNSWCTSISNDDISAKKWKRLQHLSVFTQQTNMTCLVQMGFSHSSVSFVVIFLLSFQHSTLCRLSNITWLLSSMKYLQSNEVCVCLFTLASNMFKRGWGMCLNKSLMVQNKSKPLIIITSSYSLIVASEQTWPSQSELESVGENQLGALHRSCSYLLSVRHRGEVRGQISSQELGAFTC